MAQLPKVYDVQDLKSSCDKKTAFRRHIWEARLQDAENERRKVSAKIRFAYNKHGLHKRDTRIQWHKDCEQCAYIKAMYGEYSGYTSRITAILRRLETKKYVIGSSQYAQCVVCGMRFKSEEFLSDHAKRLHRERRR